MSTLGQLKASVDSWLIRDDVAVSGADFPQIMLLAESDIARDVRCVIQERHGYAELHGPIGRLALRFFWNCVMRLLIARFVPPNFMTPQTIRESSSWSTGRSGAFYTIEAGSQAVGDERLAVTIASPASASTPLDMEVMYWAAFSGPGK